MTFGLCNAPATFQTFMNHIFKDMIDEGHVVVYLDDILIFSETPSVLDKLTHEVLHQLMTFNLYLKPEKCAFAQTSTEYLGIIITNGQVKMDPAKVAGITGWPTPHTVKHVQAFLGFCNFYRHFIKDFSGLTHPLLDLTRKDVPFHWGTSQESAFQSLIQAFITAPVLALPDHSKPFCLITDASDFATGATLEQPDALNRWHSIAYHSKSMQPAEQNYEIHNKELLAIIWALEIFRHYLEEWDDDLEVWSDHGNLVYFTMKQKLTHCQARWALYLSQFKFKIVHKPGVLNKSDALSRCLDHKEGIASKDNLCVLLDTKYFTVRAAHPTTITVLGDTTLRQRIKSSQEYDKDVSIAIEAILKNGPRSLAKGLEDWNLEDGILFFRGQVYIPKDDSLRKDIVKRYHDHIAIGHPGRWKTYKLVSGEFWWPGMSTFIKNYVDRCATCQATKIKPKTQVPLTPNQIPTDVWGIITMDFITELPISQGYDSLFVVVDCLSKATIVTPCTKTITAKETSKLYMKNV
jgi:hypothetical protein